MDLNTKLKFLYISLSFLVKLVENVFKAHHAYTGSDVALQHLSF